MPHAMGFMALARTTTQPGHVHGSSRWAQSWQFTVPRLRSLKSLAISWLSLASLPYFSPALALLSAPRTLLLCRCYHWVARYSSLSAAARADEYPASWPLHSLDGSATLPTRFTFRTGRCYSCLPQR